jgi:hypothetical protein
METQNHDAGQKLDKAGGQRLDEGIEMDKLRIRMIGREDRHGNEYYMTTTEVPCLVDLSKTVMHLFTDESEDGKEFWAELVIRKHDPRHSARDAPPKRRKRRRRSDNGKGSTTSDG